MATKLQIRNRRNARRSTGPKSPETKAIVSQNATQHGVFSTTPLLPGENLEAFESLRAAYLDLYKPTNLTQHFLVERLVQSAWRLTRLLNLEVRVIDAHLEAAEDQAETIHLITEAVRLMYRGSQNRGSQNHLSQNPGSKNGASQNSTSVSSVSAEFTWADPVARAYIRDGQTSNTITKFSRYQTALERSYYRALHQLDQLRNPPAQQPQSK